MSRVHKSIEMSKIKDRNGMDLTEAEDIKKRWQEYTEELYKKDLHDPDNDDGVITDLGPDILEGEVKWALGTITMNKASGGDGIPAEPFQIWKDDAVKVLHSICQQIWKLSSGHRTGKGQFSFQSQRKAMPENAQTTTQLHSFHMKWSEVTQSCLTLCNPMDCSLMLKILQARFQQYVNRELPDIQAEFRKGRGTRDQIGNIH